ncbi:MAG: DUF1194 domain-containing protein [Pseudomonadota bacterium]
MIRSLTTRYLGAFAFATALATALPGPAEARCRLALVLGLDVSASVDAREYRFLRDGTAAALTSDAVRQAFDALGGVHLHVFEWSGRDQQQVIAPWTALDGEGALDAVASSIAGHVRSTAEYPTALGAALGFASNQLAEGPMGCERLVIDIAGDGENNHGFAPRHAYDAFSFAGVTVNGLVVAGASDTVVDYYRSEVLRGPDAFLEVAAGYSDFEETMKRKLLREVLPRGLVLRDGRLAAIHP